MYNREHIKGTNLGRQALPCRGQWVSKAPGAFDVSPSSSLQPSRTWLRARMMFLLGTAGQQEAQGRVGAAAGTPLGQQVAEPGGAWESRWPVFPAPRLGRAGPRGRAGPALGRRVA